MPITFELGVLFAAFGTVIGMFRLNRLPKLYHPTLKHDPFLRSSDDRFFLYIDARDARFDPATTRDDLERFGGRDVALLEA